MVEAAGAPDQERQEAASPIGLVTTSSRLAEIVRYASRQPRVAVDLESNGFFRYPERVCLVQLAAGRTAFLIDPLAIPKPDPLGDLLADASVEKVVHSADYDLRSLDRDWGFRVRNLFDTSIAAAFVGSNHTGLAAVLKEHLGVEVNKSKKLQRSDWTVRPIGPEAQRYAADDVTYLERARDVLVAKLEQLSRLEWVTEECERLARVRYEPPDATWAFLSVKGSRTLDGRSLAVLRSLHGFREREARRVDRPLFKVISDATLVTLAAAPDAALATVKGLGRFGRPPWDKRLRAVIEDGMKAGPVRRPRRPRSSDEPIEPADRREAEARLRSLKKWRGELASQLDMDPGLLWPQLSLRRLSRRPGYLDAELESSEVRDWQRREFGDKLRGFLATLT